MMAAAGQLAQLFVDITLRGGGKVDLIAMRDKIMAADKALANNAGLYQRQTGAKLKQMVELATKQKELARLDQATYASPRYAKVAGAERGAKTETGMADALRDKAQLIAELKSLGTPGGMKLGDEEFANSLLGQRIEMTKKQKNLERDITKLKSPAGIEIANQAFQTKRLQKQRDELANYRAMVAEHGKLHAILSKVNDKVAAVGRAAGAAYFAMDAAILGVVAATSPDVFQTFTGSMKLLSAEIGTIFLPTIIQFAYWIQQAAAYVRDLTPETRANILAFSKWAAIVTGAIFVGTKLLAVATALSAAFADLRKFSLGAMMNPFVLGVGAAIIAVGALIAAVYHLSTMNTNAIVGNMATANRLNSGGNMTMTEFDKLDPNIRAEVLAAGSRADVSRIVNRELARNETQMDRNRQSAEAGPLNQARAQAAAAPYAMPNEGDWSTRWFTGSIDAIRGWAGEIRGQRALAPTVEQSRLIAERARLTALRDRGVSGEGRDQPDLASTHQAQFISFEQGWKRVQQEAASKSPLDERMLLVQEESRDYLRNIDANQANPLVPLILRSDGNGP